MILNKALIYGYAMGTPKGAVALDGAGIAAWKGDEGWLWVHLDRTSDEAERWLSEAADLDPLVVDALLEAETRPRTATMGDGQLIILRGVNLNVGADPEDMVSIRIWVDAKRVVSLRARKLAAAQAVRADIERGVAPESPGGLVVDVAGAMIDLMGPVLVDLNEEVDEVEEGVLDAPNHELRSRLSQFRRKAIRLRRFLAPQRDVLSRLQSERSAIFSDKDRNRLREITDRLTRYVEELDAARDRSAVTQEELAGRMSDQLNRNMYVLSIVAGIFLPLGLLTGLLGVNVGGIPGVDDDRAFVVVCVALVLLAALSVWIFRKLRIM